MKSEPSFSIERLQRLIRRTVEPLVQGATSVALIDFPSHPNVGDSAIWLGELSLLTELGISGPSYTCEVSTFDAGALERLSPEGPILLHGGGNLGDLYPHHHELRERVIRSFPDRQIVQLPQSIFFRERTNLEQARRVIGGHPNLTLLVRDRRSLEFARREFDAPSHLCPDSAFLLGTLERPVLPRLDQLWLMRTDKEAGAGPVEVGDAGTVTDWLEDDGSLVFRFHRGLRPWATRHGPAQLRRLAARLLRSTYACQASKRVERGIRLLSSARHVITDRLHGHVLCLLLDIPHTVIDDRYGKIEAFVRTWTEPSERMHLVDSVDRARSRVEKTGAL